MVVDVQEQLQLYEQRRSRGRDRSMSHVCRLAERRLSRYAKDLPFLLRARVILASRHLRSCAAACDPALDRDPGIVAPLVSVRSVLLVALRLRNSARLFEACCDEP